MGKFVFELEPALELRTRNEQSAMVIVAGIERKRVAIIDEVEAIHRQVNTSRDEARMLAGGGTGVVDVRGVRMASTSTLFAQVRLQRCAITLAGVQRQLAVAREALLKAAIARKGVEMLKQRRYQAFLAAEARRETDELDEMSISRFIRGEQGA